MTKDQPSSLTQKRSGTDTPAPLQPSVTRPGTTPLIQRCNDAYWLLDSRYTIGDCHRMASALHVIADEVALWSDQAQEKGTDIVALAIRGVAERLRDAANGKR